MRAKIAFISIFTFLWAGLAQAAPDRTMSVVPVAVSGDTISAADENARNNEIADKYNAHTHADVNTLSTNTFTIGDNAVGNKTYAVDTDQSANPGLRYNTTSDAWTVSNDGTTYLAVGFSASGAGLISGQVLVGAGGGAISPIGGMGSGQTVLGTNGNNPVVGDITSTGGITVTKGSGTLAIDPTFQSPSFTYSTSNSPGSSVGVVRSDATIALFNDSATPADPSSSASTGDDAFPARRDHVHKGLAAWQWVETLNTTSGTSVTSSTLPTDSDLFLVVFEDVRATANGELLFQPNGTATNSYQYTYVEGATWTAVTGATSIKLGDFGDATGTPIDGFLICPRLVQNNVICIDINVTYSSDDGAQTVGKTIMGKHAGMADVTTLVFTESSTAFTGGKIHIYKSIPS